MNDLWWAHRLLVNANLYGTASKDSPEVFHVQAAEARPMYAHLEST